MGYAGGRSVYVAFESWENICVAPCTASLDPNGTYRVDAPGMTPSKNFQLPAPTQQPLRKQPMRPREQAARIATWTAEASR